MSGYVTLLIVLAVLILPPMLGGYLARAFRMPDYGWKYSLILYALLASTVVTVMKWPPKLGIDLSGGVILVYEVDQEKKQPGTSVDMDKLIDAVTRRVNPGGVKEVTIRPYGQEQIEIIIPEVDEEEANRVADLVSRAGTLEFRILANQRDNKLLIEQAETDPKSKRIFDKAGSLLAWWVPVQPGQESSFNYPEIAKRIRKVRDKEIMEVLVVNDFFNVTGGLLTSAQQSTDRRGQPCVTFHFNSVGAQKFGGLTSENLPDRVTNFTRKLGIVLDDQLYSAPSIQDAIFETGEITGSFTEKQVEDQVNVLNAGSLPAALTKEPISRLYSGPTLGADTIHKSAIAMLVSSILVPLFMLWYYRFSGGVAIVALVLNMLMLMAVMITVHARFTLTGLAGLALTVGMAVDNNVLIYERLREEMERGATLRMAIRNAFHRAGVVIVDTNITHIIAATVLWVVGTDQVKGFAVTLWLGAVLSLFTSVFVARVIFETAERQRWIEKLKMLKLIGHTNIDFMGLFRYTATASVLITVVGLLVAAHRGKGLFDIDFTGGVSVQALFKQPQDIGTIRQRLKDLPDLAVSEARLGDEKEHLRYVIDTSAPDLPTVQQQLSQKFGGELVSNSLEVKNVATIEAEGEPAKPAGKTPPAKTPPAKTAAPDKKAQSRTDLPADSVLAMADDNPLILAQATKAAEKTPAAKADEEPAKKADEKAEKTPAAKADEKPVGKPEEKKAAAPAKAEEKKAPAPAKVEEKKAPAAAAKAPATAPIVERPANAANPFAGGTQADLRFGIKVNHKTATAVVTQALATAKIAPESAPFDVSNADYQQNDPSAYTQWRLEIKLPLAKAKVVLAAAEKQLAETPFFPASNAIGGAVAGSTRVQAVYALIASWLLIILYLWIRFQKVAFGVAAVIALIHDVLVMLGAVALSYYIAPYFGFLMIDPFKVNLPIVAAFLTIVGYSVNDTIVVFDRIREIRGKSPYVTVKIINDATNQTLSRTLLTSFTVFLVVIILYLFGGQAMHGFAFSLIVGVATGTYSSIYVAAPILLWMIGPPPGGETVRGPSTDDRWMAPAK